MHNIERVRNDFPALHKMLFFASAGVGPLPRSAMVVMQHYSKERRVDFARVSGGGSKEGSTGARR